MKNILIKIIFYCSFFIIILKYPKGSYTRINSKNIRGLVKPVCFRRGKIFTTAFICDYYLKAIDGCSKNIQIFGDLEKMQIIELTIHRITFNFTPKSDYWVLGYKMGEEREYPVGLSLISKLNAK